MLPVRAGLSDTAVMRRRIPDQLGVDSPPPETEAERTTRESLARVQKIVANGDKARSNAAALSKLLRKSSPAERDRMLVEAGMKQPEPVTPEQLSDDLRHVFASIDRAAAASAQPPIPEPESDTRH